MPGADRARELLDEALRLAAPQGSIGWELRIANDRTTLGRAHLKPDRFRRMRGHRRGSWVVPKTDIAKFRKRSFRRFPLRRKRVAA
jgi:hypothetical protein